MNDRLKYALSVVRGRILHAVQKHVFPSGKRAYHRHRPFFQVEHEVYFRVHQLVNLEVPLLGEIDR